jgi:tetratricopeptide (TPR) repeat protein
MFWLLVPLLFAPPAPSRSVYQDLASTLATGDLAKSQSALEQVTRREPNNARAWMLLAQTYAKQKKTQAAGTAAEKAASLGRNDAEVQQGLAYLFIELQPDLKKATGFAARYAEMRPTEREAWQRAASLYLETGRPDDAIAAGNRALALTPSAELHTILGQAYVAKRDWQNAGLQFGEAVRLSPYDEDTHFRLAQMYMLGQDFPKAVEVLLNSRQTFDKSPQIELALGVCYYGQRRFPEAVDQFLKTIRLAPAVPQPYAFLSRILEHAGDRLGEATQRFAEFNATHPRDAMGYLWYAKALVAQLGPTAENAESERALELLTKSITLDANIAETHYQVGCLLERKRDYAGAARELERSITLNPKESAAHFHLSRVYDKLGRKEQAARERELHEKLTESENAAPAASGTEPRP